MVMAGSFEHLKIEVVSPEDEQKVLSIRTPEDVYDGCDYLPYCFSRFIKFPNSSGYAVSHHGKYIAFVLVNLFDDGITYILRAVRISKNYENQGIIRWFLREIREIIRETTTVKFSITTTIREDDGAVRRVKEGKCYTVVDREMVDFENVKESKTWKTQPVDLPHTNITVIDKTLLSSILDSEGVTRIFGSKIVVNLVPFRPIKSNVTHIMQETTTVIGSDLDDIDRLLMTFGSLYEALVGTIVFLDIYGHAEENLVLHFQHHIKCALELGKCNPLIFRLYYEAEISKDFIDTVMKSCGYVSRKLPVSGCWCVETKL